MKAKYLVNNKERFLIVKKNSIASQAWKSILDRKIFIKRSLKWILGNNKSINFWRDTWLTDYSCIDKITHDKINEVNPAAKVSDFIDEERNVD